MAMTFCRCGFNNRNTGWAGDSDRRDASANLYRFSAYVVQDERCRYASMTRWVRKKWVQSWWTCVSALLTQSFASNLTRRVLNASFDDLDRFFTIRFEGSWVHQLQLDNRSGRHSSTGSPRVPASLHSHRNRGDISVPPYRPHPSPCSDSAE
jgi:hypothetical protein